MLLGISVRAAAHSARRGHFSSFGFDAFCDLDLLATCPALRVNPYPEELVSFSQQLPPTPWLYTGALENHPEIVASIAARHPLLGNPASVLEKVRTPCIWGETLRAAGITVPSYRDTSPEETSSGSWLIKPLRSGGGLHIAEWSAASSAPTDQAYYFQQKISGYSHSAIYLANGSSSLLWGITQQLHAADFEAGSCEYLYAGSIGPVRLGLAVEAQLQTLGKVLATEFGLTGLFGVDFILTETHQAVPVEINPRYTASVEILERATGHSAVKLHVDACRFGALPEAVALQTPTRSDVLHGKAILYAPAPIQVSAALSSQLQVLSRMPPADIRPLQPITPNGQWPQLADLPPAETEIPAGAPVLTLFAQAGNALAVKKALDESRQQLLQQIACFR